MSPAEAAHAAGAEAGADATLGPMPEWDLGDLYSSTDAPELARDFK